MLEEFNKIVIDFKDGFFNLIPKLLLALVVLGIGYLLARFIRFLVIRLVGHISKLITKTFPNIKLGQYASLIGTVFFGLMLLYTFLLLTDILGLSVITTWVDSLLTYTPNLIAAILIIITAIILGNFVSDFMLSAGKKFELHYISTLGRIGQYFILITAIIIAIDQIGVEVTFLVNLINIIIAALLFGAALAFGIGARTSVSNILATFYVRKMYREGDQVKIGDIEGMITRIDGTVVVVDNEAGQYFIPAKEFNETRSFLIKKNK